MTNFNRLSVQFLRFMKLHWKYWGRLAQVAALVYISACIAGLASAPSLINGLFYSNDLPDFVVSEINSRGAFFNGKTDA